MKRTKETMSPTSQELFDMAKKRKASEMEKSVSKASKGNYVVELIPNMYNEQGIRIEGTTRTFAVINVTTGKSLKIKSYSDIKEILYKHR